MPRRAQPLPDLVRDSEIEATVFENYTIQVIHKVGRSARQRVVRIEERWVRDGCLGAGAYGIVYKERCEGASPSRVRAVKEIKKCAVGGEEIDHTRELEAIAKFSHPRYAHCFVRSHGWYGYGDAVYITMEYLEHGDLQRYLTRPLPEAEAREITSQVLEGLKHMHDNRFVHRDLKPGNIMVVEQGPNWWVKIADFGISKRRHELTTSLQTPQMGTFAFAAPEAVGVSDDEQGSTHATALDIWSLGAVAFRMMTNTAAFPNLKELSGYCSGRRSFPTERLQAHAISVHGQDFVAGLMVLKPEERPSVDQARQHPWTQPGSTPETNSSPWAMDAVVQHASSDTPNLTNAMTSSEPSASWSYIEQTEATALPRPRAPKIFSNYRSPYVEDCSDESQDETQRSRPMSPTHNSSGSHGRTHHDDDEGFGPSLRTASNVNDFNDFRTATRIDSRQPEDQPSWRKFPLVIVQDKGRNPRNDNNPSPRHRSKKAVRFDGGFDTMSVDGWNDTPGDEESDINESPLDTMDLEEVGEAESSGEESDTANEPPSWDLAYWKYKDLLEKATSYIERSKSQSGQAWREAMEQSSDSQIELPPEADPLNLERAAWYIERSTRKRGQARRETMEQSSDSQSLIRADILDKAARYVENSKRRRGLA